MTRESQRFLRAAAVGRLRPLYTGTVGRIKTFDDMKHAIQGVYPEKANFMEPNVFSEILRAAEAYVEQMNLPMNTGPLCIALTYTFFGAPAFSDPLLAIRLEGVFAAPLIVHTLRHGETPCSKPVALNFLNGGIYERAMLPGFRFSDRLSGL
jgi:hypothetical protein